jgi:threonine dehydratase
MIASQLRTSIPNVPDVVLKLEQTQVTGSFKARGAMNRLLATPQDELRKGIVTASGGNHGIAVARSAYVAGVASTIFVPRGVSAEKVEKIREWNGHVEEVGDDWTITNVAAHDYAAKTGAMYFHPFADALVVAGQGTVALEILDDLPDVDLIVVAVGGGGLIAGIATAVRGLKPSAKVVGVEPVGSPTLERCIAAGKLVELPSVSTRVMTMSCRKTDQRVFETVRDNVDRIVLVSDEAMEAAAQWLWFEMGIAADLSGAASIAALREAAIDIGEAKCICALVCGAGADGLR